MFETGFENKCEKLDLNAMTMVPRGGSLVMRVDRLEVNALHSPRDRLGPTVTQDRRKEGRTRTGKAAWGPD